MKDYVEIVFENGSAGNDLLLAALVEEGFESFEEENECLKAFIPLHDLNVNGLELIAKRFNLPYKRNIIPPTNWNKDWESGFEPVIVDDFVSVRASFHQPNDSVEHEIIITPKMSFGTGHHATTFLMMRAMRKIPLSGASILDFGTGTGVLAILAEKCGATNVVAIDNDEWSMENAKENVHENNCRSISLYLRDNPAIETSFDVILANINKNVILDNLHVLSRQLHRSGVILLSGLLKEDEEEVVVAAKASGLGLLEKNIRDNWLCLKLGY